MRVNSNGLPHLAHGGRRLSTNLYFGASSMALIQHLYRRKSESIPHSKTGRYRVAAREVRPPMKEHMVEVKRIKAPSDIPFEGSYVLVLYGPSAMDREHPRDAELSWCGMASGTR
jgi:hypothetical protein